MEIRNFKREAQASRSLLQSVYQKLDEQKKQVEQWKAIAEKLATNHVQSCFNAESCWDCIYPNCVKKLEKPEDELIRYAKKELGYETV